MHILPQFKKKKTTISFAHKCVNCAGLSRNDPSLLHDIWDLSRDDLNVGAS